MTTVNIGLMLSMLAIAGLFAGGFLTMAPIATYAQEIENEAEASNEDNDDVDQENNSKIEQESKIKCDADADVDDNDFIGFTGSNTAVAANDCDNTQVAIVGQSNTNTDNDFQVADADACQQVASLVGFSIC
jgi:PBP1b-binding outer membrane lipoprotein LpoB